MTPVTAAVAALLVARAGDGQLLAPTSAKQSRTPAPSQPVVNENCAPLHSHNTKTLELSLRLSQNVLSILTMADLAGCTLLERLDLTNNALTLVPAALLASQTLLSVVTLGPRPGNRDRVAPTLFPPGQHSPSVLCCVFPHIGPFRMSDATQAEADCGRAGLVGIAPGLLSGHLCSGGYSDVLARKPGILVGFASRGAGMEAYAGVHPFRISPHWVETPTEKARRGIEDRYEIGVFYTVKTPTRPLRRLVLSPTSDNYRALRFYLQFPTQPTGSCTQTFQDPKEGDVGFFARCSGHYTARIVLVDGGRLATVVDEWDFEAMVADTSVPAYGPEGKDCPPGHTPSDSVPLDRHFECVATELPPQSPEKWWLQVEYQLLWIVSWCALCFSMYVSCAVMNPVRVEADPWGWEGTTPPQPTVLSMATPSTVAQGGRLWDPLKGAVAFVNARRIHYCFGPPYFRNGYPVFVSDEYPYFGGRDIIWRQGDRWCSNCGSGNFIERAWIPHVGGDPNLPPWGGRWTTKGSFRRFPGTLLPEHEFDLELARACGWWSFTTHRQFPRPHRRWVEGIMLCAQRISRGRDGGEGGRRAMGSPSLPHMPLELWAMILSFIHLHSMLPPTETDPTRTLF
eukprot:m.467830 g.467830  ORF g.467830 m.467830 type:complete len:625 (+) comp26919_c0_seq1:192-2066(+)